MFFKNLKISTLIITMSILLLNQPSIANTCERPPNKHQLDYIACPYEGLSVVEKKGKRGFVDLSGNIVIPIIYNDANSFSEGVAKVNKGGKTFFINHKGEILFQVPKTIEVLGDFSENLVVVKQNGKIGFMDKMGNIAIAFQYDNASSFREGLAAVVNNHKQGFINSQGQIVIPIQYDEATKFFDGLASVRIGNHWGVINQKGELVIPMIYDFIHIFKDTKTTDAKLNGEWIKIDKQGNQVNHLNQNENFNNGITHEKITNILNQQ